MTKPTTPDVAGSPASPCWADIAAHEIRSGSDDIIIRWRDCPTCKGRGWLIPLTDIFREYNKRFYQCKVCLDTKAHFDKHGCLPNASDHRADQETSHGK